MKPLSERDENLSIFVMPVNSTLSVGMKPLSERDENFNAVILDSTGLQASRNEATL